MSENNDRTALLRSRLRSTLSDSIPSNQLGHASYAYLKEEKPELAWDTPSGAAQTWGILRKGQTLGATNLDRLGAFLDHLGNYSDAAAQVDYWIARNGHEPTHPADPEAKEAPPELAISQETQKAMASAFGQVKLLYDQKKSELTRKEDELSGLRAEVRQMEQILKAAGIIPRETRKGHPGRRTREEPEPKKKQSKGSHVSDAKAQEILAEIKKFVASNPPVLPDVPGSFTRPQIEKLGFHHSAIGAAVEKLREQGYVRAAGLAMVNNQKTNVFAVIA